MPNFVELNFLKYFQFIEDRRLPNMLTYPSDEIILLTLCAAICGANDWEEISEYGENQLSFLRTLLPYNNGVPQGQTLNLFYNSIDLNYFSDCFSCWVSSLTSNLSGVVAIDGKALRGTRDSDDPNSAIYIVSAFAHSCGLVIGQDKVKEKSNEITAIPQLLKKLVIDGTIVTIDAMGCQQEIAQQVITNKADYILALKGNQPNLYEDVKLLFEEQYDNFWKDCSFDFYEEIDSSHGRIETRKCWVTDDIEWLKEEHKWKNLTSIIMIEATRDIKGRKSIERRFYISSLKANAFKCMNAIRAHWSIENSLHWVMDVVFMDDKNLTKNANAVANLHIVKQMALNLLKSEKSDKPIKRKRKAAGWNSKFLLDVLKTKPC